MPRLSFPTRLGVIFAILVVSSLGVLVSIHFRAIRGGLNGTERRSMRFLMNHGFRQLRDYISYENGVVLCLHDGIVAMGVSLVRELRCLGNQEVIQVYHCLNELSPKSIELLTRNDRRVQVIDVCSEMVAAGRMKADMAPTFKSYWIKPLAVYHTNITNVLLLDADVIAMRDPAVIRSTPGYKRTGTMFFYDRVVPKNANFNKLVPLTVNGTSSYQFLRVWLQQFPYRRFNITNPRLSAHMNESFAYNGMTCHEQDSSIVAIDKRRARKALDVLWAIMTESRLLFSFSWGDKEAFWLSWEFSQSEYTFSPWGIAAIEAAHNRDFAKHNETMCGNMAHYLPVEDTEPELLYVNGKSALEPYQEEKMFSTVFNYNPQYVSKRHRRQANPRIEGQPQNQECLVGMGADPLPAIFHRRILRRRIHAFALATKSYEWLDMCEDQLPSINE